MNKHNKFNTLRLVAPFAGVAAIYLSSFAGAQDVQVVNDTVVRPEWQEEAIRWGTTGAKALVILIVGWLAAWIISKLVVKLLDKTRLSNRLTKLFPGVSASEDYKIEKWGGRIVFWFLMLFVLMMVFQALDLTLVAGPLGGFLETVTEFLPKIFAALGLGLLAFLLATAVRLGIRKALDATSIDEKLAEKTDADPSAPSVPLSKTLSEVAYWVVILLFVPMILGVLELTGLLQPVQDMFNGIFAYLPNVLGAALILGIGWFIAKLLRRIVTGLLASMGADRFGAKIGIKPSVERKGLSEVVGLIVFTLVALVTLVSALDALNIAAISGPATDMLDQILTAIPKIITAAIILGVAWFIGKLLADLVDNLLAGVGFNNLFTVLGFKSADALQNVENNSDAVPAGSTASATVSLSKARPSRIAGKLVLAATMFLAAIQAFDAMDLDSLKIIAASLLDGLFHVVLGLVIFGIGLFIANYVSNLILSSSRPNAKILATLAKISILFIVGAMALREMGLGEIITTTAFSVAIISVGVAFALSFGLGGRQAASEIIEKWRKKVDSGQS